MSIAVRLDDELVHDAETTASLHRRTTPKQIEYWAQIGKIVSHTTSGEELLYLMEGLAEVEIHPRSVEPIDADALFDELDHRRDTDDLAHSVTNAKVRYEASRKYPGLLDRIGADGERQSGLFRNGEFVPKPPKTP